jgi:cytochrome bd-type quinol oxidase subunit 2
MDLVARRRIPFLAFAAVGVVACVVIVALPDSLLVQIERNRPFDSSQAGWAYRLLVLFALVAAGFTMLRAFTVDSVKRAQERNPKPATPERIVDSVAQNAAAVPLLTIVYGVASLVFTGQRGGFWLFPVIALAQGAWHYRSVGEIARWLSFQPEPEIEEEASTQWKREPPDYCPPLARGLLAGRG